MFDAELLKRLNHCRYTGLETYRRHKFGSMVRIFECKATGRIRLVGCDPILGPVAGLIVNPYNRVRTYTVEAVFTLESHRRQGYARQLLAVARVTLGTVQHNGNLTADGRAWRDSVESLK
jgi:GNAT superfamily N-acetyltransferase